MFKNFLSYSAFLKEVVPPSDHPLIECLEALNRVVVGVFGQIIDPGFENDISTFEEMFMGVMQTHNPKDDTEGACARLSCAIICAPYRSSTRTYF